MSRWFRFYADAMRNPKVAQLSDADFRFWVKLLCVASENDGKIPCDDNLKLLLGGRLDHLKGGLKRLLNGGLIDALDYGYEPHNWSKFQYKSDTSRDRVAKHRAARNVTVTPPDTDTDTEYGVDGSAGVREANFDAVKLADEAARAAGVRHVDPAQIVRHGSLILEWLQAGADPPLILATIRDNRAKPDAPPITSMKYFDTEIRRQIAAKEALANGHTATPPRQPGGNPAPPSGRTGAVLRLLAEVRAANADKPGNHGTAS